MMILTFILSAEYSVDKLIVPTTPEEEPVHVQPSDQERELVFNSELMQEVEREIAAEPRDRNSIIHAQ